MRGDAVDDYTPAIHEVAWQGALLAGLTIGGCWTIPAVALTFRKTGPLELTLTERGRSTGPLRALQDITIMRVGKVMACLGGELLQEA